MMTTLNPLEAQLARDMFAAGRRQLADREIAAAVHTFRTREGGDTFPTVHKRRWAACELARVWYEWLVRVDGPKILRSPEWVGFLGGVGGRGRHYAAIGGEVVGLVEEAVEYAASDDGRGLDAAALDYGWRVLELTRGWRRDDPPAAGKDGLATSPVASPVVAPPKGRASVIEIFAPKKPAPAAAGVARRRLKDRRPKKSKRR